MATAQKGITKEQLIKDLQNKIYHPVYFLTGDEPYYIDKITEFILATVLTEAEKAFNQTIIYGKDNDAIAVMNSAKRFPMMSNYQLVVVKEAQELKNFEDLVYYIEKPLKSTILVLNYKYKALDKRKKIAKALQENSVFFESRKLYDNKIPEWISSALARKKYKIEPKAAVLLTEFLGNDLSRISNELDKLIIVLNDNTKVITSQDIERNIGISKEYNNFELQNALATKNVLKANQIINYFAENQKNNNIVVTVSTLFSFFSKVLVYSSLEDKSRSNVRTQLRLASEFFASDFEFAHKNYNKNKVAEIISLLRECDAKSKGYGNVSMDAGDLLKELIFKILH